MIINFEKDEIPAFPKIMPCQYMMNFEVWLYIP